MKLFKFLFFYPGRELGFRKPSAQSSTFQDQKTGAYKAVNGRAVDTDILQCSATQEADNPAWMVDLGMLYKIHRLVLHNLEINGTRGNCQPIHQRSSTAVSLCFKDLLKC